MVGSFKEIELMTIREEEADKARTEASVKQIKSLIENVDKAIEAEMASNPLRPGGINVFYGFPELTILEVAEAVRKHFEEAGWKATLSESGRNRWDCPLYYLDLR
jgi:hypothetical protein